jgi:hypothetical protein
MVSAVPALAQTGDTSQIFGTVRDESGGVVPGATVTTRNRTTGLERTTVTSDKGEYVVPSLPLGTYSITISLDGFRTLVRDGIALRVDQQARVDALMAVGNVAEMTTVVGGPPLLETRSATLKDVVDERRMVDLPLNGRNPLELTLLVPAVQVTPATSINTGSTRPGQVNISASGGRGNTIAHLLDGADNSDNYTNVSNVYPNPDALAEFSVQTNNFSAEYGRRLGGVINAITKSGTNAFHGSGFEFFRDESMNASNFFTPGRGDGLKRHQYGASIGGPLVENRAFFFGSWQGTNIRQLPVDVTAVVPTAAMRAGDFSDLRNAAGQLIVVRDPATGLPFLNNQIPVERFDAVARRLLDYVPTPADARGRLQIPLVNESDDHQLVGKVDVQLTSSTRLTTRYLYDKLVRPNPVIETNILSGQRTPDFITHNFQASATHVFSPRLLGVFSMNYNGLESTFEYGYPTTLRELGADLADLSPNKDISIAVTGFFTIPQLGIGPVNRDNLQLQSSFTLATGRHELKAGTDLLWQVQDLPGAGFQSNGHFDFANAFSGSNLTDFLLGLPSRFNQATPQTQRLEAFNPGLYVQDTFRVSSRLTINAGLRYEPYLPWVETHNRQAAVWQPGQQSQRAPGLPPNLLVVGDPGVPEAGHDKAWNRFDPRVGVVLLPDERSSLRAAFGIFHEFPGSIVNNRMTLAPPFAVAVNIQNPTSLSSPWTAATPNPYPTDLPPDPSFRFPSPLAPTVYGPDFSNAYARQWNMSYERQLAGAWVGRVSYIGSQTRNLLVNREINPGLPAPGATLNNINQRRQYFPAYSSVVQFESTGRSNYHALAVSGEKRYSDNYSVTGSYTFSRSRDLGGATVAGGAGAFYSNPADRENDYGRSDFDRPHRFVGTVIWDIPGGNDNAVLHYLLSRWQISATFTAESGAPVNVLAGSDRSVDGVAGDRPDQTGDPQLSSDRSRAEQIAEWFDTGAFQQATLGAFGSAPRNSVRGPGFASLDMSLVKSFEVGPTRAQFRIEAFNALNRVNLGQPNSTLSSPLFGQISQARDPRILQLAVRVVF